jgi:hypothetical protein
VGSSRDDVSTVSRRIDPKERLVLSNQLDQIGVAGDHERTP